MTFWAVIDITKPDDEMWLNRKRKSGVPQLFENIDDAKLARDFYGYTHVVPVTIDAPILSFRKSTKRPL